MSITPLWAKALQIPKALLDEWLTIAPIEESFTFWCLFTGRISVDNYFRWAKENYGIAFLEAGYFQQEPNRQLWSQIHSVANWSPWLLPIEQWDGVVFVACVEPPLEHTWSFPVSYVLADPNQLERLWQRLHNQDITETMAAMTTSTTTEILDGKTLFDIPVGLQKAGDGSASPLDGPMGLNISNLHLGADTQEATSPLPPDIEMPTAVTAAPLSPPEAEPQSNLGPIDMAAGPDQIAVATTDEQCLAWFFKQLRSRFSTGVAMIYNKNYLSGWKWDSGLTPTNPQLAIAFDGPSLFRITARTLRSYHGHVVDNPIHQAFFKAWGFTNPPAHITAVPIIVAGGFHGVFVCISNESLGVDALEFAERIAGQTIMQMEKINDGIFGSVAA